VPATANRAARQQRTVQFYRELRWEKAPAPQKRARAGSILVEQTYITDGGRRRRRLVRVDLDEVRLGHGLATACDRGDWQRIRELLERTVGETTFEIWLDPAQLVAIDEQRRLVIAVPAATASWTMDRFGALLASCADRVGRELRFASETELRALASAQRPDSQPRREVAG
jgi:DnaA N-terminal domain